MPNADVISGLIDACFVFAGLIVALAFGWWHHREWIEHFDSNLKALWRNTAENQKLFDERIAHLEDVINGLAGQIVTLGGKPTSGPVNIESSLESSILDAALAREHTPCPEA